MKFCEPGRHQAATQIGAYFALLETIKRYQNEGIEPPAENCVPAGWLCRFWLCFPYGGENVGRVEKAERVFWGIQEFSSCCFAQVTRVTASTKSALFLLLRNSGCQITDKYQTATPCRPHYLRRAVKNILRPALPP